MWNAAIPVFYGASSTSAIYQSAILKTQIETPALEIPCQQQADNIRGKESFVLINSVMELIQCVAIVLSSCFENIYIN